MRSCRKTELTAVAAPAADTSDYYHPTMGRFISRNPDGKLVDKLKYLQKQKKIPEVHLKADSLTDLMGVITETEAKVIRAALKKIMIQHPPAV